MALCLYLLNESIHLVGKASEVRVSSSSAGCFIMKQSELFRWVTEARRTDSSAECERITALIEMKHVTDSTRSNASAILVHVICEAVSL